MITLPPITQLFPPCWRKAHHHCQHMLQFLTHIIQSYTRAGTQDYNSYTCGASGLHHLVPYWLSGRDRTSPVEVK